MAFGRPKGPPSVPAPQARTDFVLGSRPAVLRAPSMTRIAPKKSGTREYGKLAKAETPGFGRTGMDGEN